MSSEDEEEERRRAQTPAPLPRGDTRPTNHYAPLEEAAELAPFQKQLSDNLATNAPPTISPPQTTLRQDNELVSATIAAAQHAETRKAHDEKIARQALENATALTHVANETRSVSSRFDTLEQEPLSLLEEKRLRRDNSNTRQGESYFQNAMQGQSGSGSPYDKLERAAATEYATFCRDQNDLDKQVSNAHDPTERNPLERKKDIHAANYLAATSHRIADQWEIITDSAHSEDAANARVRANAFEAEAKKLQAKQYLYTETEARTDVASIALQNEEAVRNHESSSGRFDSSAIERESRRPENYDGPAGSVELTDAQRDKMSKVAEKGTKVEGKDWAYVDSHMRTGGGGGGGRGGRTV